MRQDLSLNDWMNKKGYFQPDLFPRDYSLGKGLTMKSQLMCKMGISGFSVGQLPASVWRRSRYSCLGDGGYSVRRLRRVVPKLLRNFL